MNDQHKRGYGTNQSGDFKFTGETERLSIANSEFGNVPAIFSEMTFLNPGNWSRKSLDQPPVQQAEPSGPPSPRRPGSLDIEKLDRKSERINKRYREFRERQGTRHEKGDHDMNPTGISLHDSVSSGDDSEVAIPKSDTRKIIKAPTTKGSGRSVSKSKPSTSPPEIEDLRNATRAAKRKYLAEYERCNYMQDRAERYRELYGELKSEVESLRQEQAENPCKKNGNKWIIAQNGLKIELDNSE